MKQIVAIGGGGFMAEPYNPLLDRYIVEQSGKDRPAVCYVPTASGDSIVGIADFFAAYTQLACRPSFLPLFRQTIADLGAHLLAQDVIYVGGGNTRNMLALWRLWGLDAVFREAYQRGILLCGVSAGSVCWFQEGVTDSWAGDLRPLECLGLLEGSNCPHYNAEPGRRPAYQRLVGSGAMLPGYAADDGVALHYRDGALHKIASAKPGAKAYRVERSDGAAKEIVIEPTHL
jgi:dipeptidase E